MSSAPADWVGPVALASAMRWAVLRACNVFLGAALGMLIALFAQPAAAGADIPGEFRLTAESKFLRLYLDPISTQLVVEDKRNGTLWPSNPMSDANGSPRAPASRLNAVFSVFYTNLQGRLYTREKDSVDEGWAHDVVNVPRGVAVNYSLDELGMRFQIVYRLGDDYLEVDLPNGQITETSDRLFARIEPLPFFGAVPAGTHGYFLIPDGSGALVRFVVEKPRHSWPTAYTSDFYGPTRVQFGLTEWTAQHRWVHARNVGHLGMPVFGMVAGDSAFLAIVDQGSADARLVASLARKPSGLNHIRASFILRRQAESPVQRGIYATRFLEDTVDSDRRLRYYFLYGSDASYVGMAQRYRQYLQEERGVPRLRGPVYPLHLRFFMGVERPSFIFPEFIRLTTYDQVIAILEDLKQRGVEGSVVTLVGWEQGGYAGRWPFRLPPDGRLGGADGLRRLADYCTANGCRLVLQDQYVLAFDRNGGFSANSDVVRAPNQLPITTPAGQHRIYLLNPIFSRDHYLVPDVSELGSMGVEGLIISDVGRIALADYNHDNPLSPQQFTEVWRENLRYIRQAMGWVGVAGPNDALLGAVDHFDQFPLGRYDLELLDESIPFLPIAIHGLATYAGTPGNLRLDTPRDFLRQLEYGALPTFELTYEQPVGLNRTVYDHLFSSQYRQWLEQAVTEYTLARDHLGSTWREFIVNHERLAPGVFSTTYEGGTRVIVNYGERTYREGSLAVPGGGYAVIKGKAASTSGVGR